MATGGAGIERTVTSASAEYCRILKDIAVRMNAVDRNHRHSGFTTLRYPYLLPDIPGRYGSRGSQKSALPTGGAGMNGV